MNPNFTIGRIAGIRISFNWSWLIFVGLIVWSLDSYVFPLNDPGLSSGTYLAMSVIAAAVFFVSLLLHEIGHSVVARRNGMEIEGITLWLFGGVSRFREMFKSPGAEFRIGIAGPAVSFVLGALFVGLALLPIGSTPVTGTLFWLGYINLLLLVFNLLPALPLDGGRVFRSALWKAKGDFVWATKVAVSFGRGFGYLMIVAGIYFFLAYSSVSGVWLALIGWFLLGAAGGEARFLRAREALAGLHVRDLMTREPVTAPADETLGDFADSLSGLARHSTYPVVSNGAVLGLLPFSAIAAQPRPEWESRLVRDSMLAPGRVPFLDSDETAENALDELAAGDIRRGVVVHEAGLVGFLSISDIARVLTQRSAFRR
ncbi:MAG: site-2 protease family protein [Gaiellaceae bacterium]|jgi:Zn-dependent protease